jgi:hypothetical protein
MKIRNDSSYACLLVFILLFLPLFRSEYSQYFVRIQLCSGELGNSIITHLFQGFHTVKRCVSQTNIMSCHSKACKDHLFFKFTARLIPLQYLLNLESCTNTVYVKMYSSFVVVTRTRTGRPRNRGSVPSRDAFPGGKAAGT